MDARVLLRRYLEQRRELGESELVLDGLNVEDVMRLLGATGASAPSTEPRRSVRQLAGEPSDDWRTTLKEAGIMVDAPIAPTQATTAPTPPPNKRLAFPPEPLSSSSAAETVDETSVANPVVAPRGIVIGSDEAELIPGAIGKLESLDEIAKAVKDCTRCSLYKTATNPVPGEGNPNAELVCVGEAPGAKEDETGRPFIGQAGQLLTRILAAIELTREEVFICNVLKHRPPGNRNPLPEEVAACGPYLIRQLELIKPKVIVAFGTFAAQTLLNTKSSLGQLRGLVHQYHGIPLIVTYHPAALLRNPAWKRPTWEDVKLARRVLDSSPRS
ncbi:MAG TPA: uracil-DNA glycosylase [Gemmatimonadaceae bacterium]|jgi:DNA polymerase|nr:uracil-DNA glycosylase [Gemmatimonadaceae bacterium]